MTSCIYWRCKISSQAFTVLIVDGMLTVWFYIPLFTTDFFTSHHGHPCCLLQSVAVMWFTLNWSKIHAGGRRSWSYVINIFSCLFLDWCCFSSVLQNSYLDFNHDTKAINRLEGSGDSLYLPMSRKKVCHWNWSSRQKTKNDFCIEIQDFIQVLRKNNKQTGRTWYFWMCKINCMWSIENDQVEFPLFWQHIKHN